MYPYILCLCGRSLGELYLAFKEARQFLIGENCEEHGVDIDPIMLVVSDHAQVELCELLDGLGLPLTCCRTRMLSMTEFRDYY